jgi:hypothetical protein
VLVAHCILLVAFTAFGSIQFGGGGGGAAVPVARESDTSRSSRLPQSPLPQAVINDINPHLLDSSVV